MNIKKKVIISSVSIIAILAILYSYYYCNKIKPYNNALSNANQAVASEEYDKAIGDYTEALNYKKDVNVSKNIEIAKFLKKSKENYNSADKQMRDKKYLEAIDLFKKIDKQDDKRYLIAQNKINECAKLYIVDNLKTANDNMKTNKFEQANKYIENIFKIDITNADANKLKSDIDKSIEKQKKENEEAKKENDVRLKSQGHFVDERHYNIFLNEKLYDPNNLSGISVTLSNLNGNNAEIGFLYSSTGGGTTDNGQGPATYVGNGEWRFTFETMADPFYGIGIFKIIGDNAYIARHREHYDANSNTGNKKIFTEEDYNEISNGQFCKLYKINK